MAGFFQNSAGRASESLLHLIEQLDEQLYGRLYELRPLTFEGRFRLFVFCYATCVVTCLNDEGGAAAGRAGPAEKRLEEDCITYLARHHSRYFPDKPETTDLQSVFGELSQQYKLDLQLAASRLGGAQRAQAHAVVRQALSEIVYGENMPVGEEPKVMIHVHELINALPRLREAFGG